MSKNTNLYVQTFSRGLQILELLALKKAVTVTTLAKHLSLPKSASYRFLNTLRLHGYVEQDEYNNYVLTERLTQLSTGNVPDLEFHTIVMRILTAMVQKNKAFESVGNFGKWNGKEVVYLAQTQNTYSPFHDGHTVAGYCSAMGKAILASFSPEDLKQYIENTKFEKFTEDTTSSGKELRSALEISRKKGYALMKDELHPGLKGIALLLMKNNEPTKYSISISALYYGSIESYAKHCYPLLKEAAEEISQYIELGIYSPVL